ncbi:hypothetical protein [Streptomyces chartreusis]|uniref:hypothetical protein n=1 Tax=Streptomyces chartreusis TaxID=1969 RepID=UPI00363D2BF8
MIPPPHRTKGPGVLGAEGPGQAGPFGRWIGPGGDEADEPDEETSGRQPAIRTPGYRADINLSANGCGDVTEAGKPPAKINGLASTAVPMFPKADHGPWGVTLPSAERA